MQKLNSYPKVLVRKIQNQLISICECGSNQFVYNFRHGKEKINTQRRPLQEIQNVVPTPSSATSSLQSKYTSCILNNAASSEAFSTLIQTTITLKGCCKKTYEIKVVCNDVHDTEKSTKACKTKWKSERQYRITGSRYIFNNLGLKVIFSFLNTLKYLVKLQVLRFIHILKK